MQIAIDGPAGVGKSTVARNLANKLGILFLDTGAMYRLATLLVIRYGLGIEELLETLKTTQFYFNEKKDHLSVRYHLKGMEYFEDVSDAIRSQEVTLMVSEVSTDSRVRKILTSIQQKIAKEHEIVMEGRDIGTTVLPQASHKFFLVASAEERARRRCLELGISLEGEGYSEILKSIIKRDYADTHRDVSPLIRASDAKEIDTTYLTMDEVIGIMYDEIMLDKFSRK